MGFDSPVIFPLFSPSAANQVYSGSCNTKARPFTMPGRGKLRRLAISNGAAGPAHVQAGFSSVINMANAFIYTANNNGPVGTVTVINVQTKAVIATINVGNNPVGLAVTPDGKFVYVTNSAGDSVSVIATVTNTVIATPALAVGAGPDAVAITPDGISAYVTNYSNGTVSVITVATNVVAATLAVGAHPDAIVITPDGLFAYIGNSTDNSISVIATATNTVIATVILPTFSASRPAPGALAITPDGAYVYIEAGGSAGVYKIYILATATNTFIGSITSTVGAGALAISPDGKYLWHTTGLRLEVYSIATGLLLATPVMGLNTAGIPCFTPDGAFVYVTNGGSTVIAWNTATYLGVAVAATNVQNGFIASTPIPAVLSMGVNLSLNSEMIANSTVFNEVPLNLIAGTPLAIASDVPGIIHWSVEIENT